MGCAVLHSDGMATYVGLVTLGFVAVLLFRARGIYAVLWSRERVEAGDYEGALRRVRWVSLGIPNALVLHRKGLILSMAGRPAEAEQCYRQAIATLQSDSQYRRERLYACLAFVLMDLTRYEEAEEYFHKAIETGDVTGSSQDGLAELRLVRGADTEQALNYARQAIEHGKRRPRAPSPEFFYSHEAWALALLGRKDEARESLGKALCAAVPLGSGTAELHWRAGMVLLALEAAGEARQHFQMASDADPRGKYGRRSAERLRGAA